MQTQQFKFAHCTIELLLGDITRIPVDAIVNAANSALAGGGGVDGAIHRAAGPGLMADLKKHPGCPTGSAVVTGAGRLPAKYVFHAVGPVYRDGRHKEPELLASCYKTALRLAIEYNCESISFPAISAGVYGYPFRDAAEIALSAIAQATSASGSTLRLVKLVQFSQPGYDTYHDLLINFPTPQTSAETS